MVTEKQLIPREHEEVKASPEKALTLADTIELGKVLQESGFFPGITGKAQAVAKIMAGRELGLGPVYSLQMIDLVQGRLRLRSEVMAALINRSAHYSYLIKTLTDQEAVIEFSKDGKPLHISKFTLEDAKRAGLLKPDSGWAKYPKDMLFSRAISAGAKKVCPELMMGMETLEEGGFEEVEGHVVKEGEPPPSAWQSFWSTVKEREYDEAEVHKLLGVASIKDWLETGKSLADALQRLPNKQGQKTIDALWGKEEPKEPLVKSILPPEAPAKPKVPPGEKRVFANAGAWAYAVQQDGGNLKQIMKLLNLESVSELDTPEKREAAWQTHLNLKQEKLI